MLREIMPRVPFINDILNYDSLSIVGLQKNTGKTECLKYVLDRLPVQTKRIAVRDMMQMKQALESQYSLSEDYEDDGTAFFCGGLAPTGIGRLFTLSVLPHRGRWAMLLQYGPFHYKD